MAKTGTISIVIPVYNEGAVVEALINRVAAADTSPYRAEIIAVDDGSADETPALLASLAKAHQNLRVISLPGNYGKSHALREGFAAATGEIIIVQDADLEYAPEEYPRLLEPFNDPEVRVVYGSRFLAQKWPRNMRPENWLANRIFTMLVNLLFAAGITDEGTAYKAFRHDVIREVPLRSSGFSFCAEITCKLAARKIPIHEVPVSYNARSKREGKKPRFLDGVKIVATILTLRMRTLFGEHL
jgi:glycosyltransferase involved in cell wall biosynthesis